MTGTSERVWEFESGRWLLERESGSVPSVETILNEGEDGRSDEHRISFGGKPSLKLGPQGRGAILDGETKSETRDTLVCTCPADSSKTNCR